MKAYRAGRIKKRTLPVRIVCMGALGDVHRDASPAPRPNLDIRAFVLKKSSEPAPPLAKGLPALKLVGRLQETAPARNNADLGVDDSTIPWHEGGSIGILGLASLRLGIVANRPGADLPGPQAMGMTWRRKERMAGSGGFEEVWYFYRVTAVWPEWWPESVRTFDE